MEREQQLERLQKKQKIKQDEKNGIKHDGYEIESNAIKNIDQLNLKIQQTKQNIKIKKEQVQAQSATIKEKEKQQQDLEKQAAENRKMKDQLLNQDMFNS